MFQLSFAVITGVLVICALVERMRFAAVLWFAAFWSPVVYVPTVHWFWELGEWAEPCSPSQLGLCAGRVAVTPGAAALIGAIAGLSCDWGATALKRLLRADDSLDVLGVRGIDGLFGSLPTSVFADARLSGVSGSVGMPALAIAAVALYGALSPRASMTEQNDPELASIADRLELAMAPIVAAARLREALLRQAAGAPGGLAQRCIGGLH